MDIPTYRKEHSLSQAAFAALLTESGSPATQSLVSHWEKGTVLVPPERWAVIAAVTGGAVSQCDLRPDIFGTPPSAPEEGTAADHQEAA